MRQKEDLKWGDNIHTGASGEAAPAKCCFIKVDFDTLMFMLCVEHIQTSPVKTVMVKNVKVLI